MAKLERDMHEDYELLKKRITEGILSGSASASMEYDSEYCSGDVRCSIKVFERYSWLGKNRVSLTVTLFQPGKNLPVQVRGVTSGGSQALFHKWNTIGENNFLKKLEELL